MTKSLRVPNEYRFVRAFALAVEPGDTLAGEHAAWCPGRQTSYGEEQRTMNVPSDLDVQLQELAEFYYHSLEDQLYDPDRKVDGFGKERQKEYIVALLQDLARDAVTLILDDDVTEAAPCPTPKSPSAASSTSSG